MPIATGLALLIGGLASAGASAASGALGSKAATNAADLQAQATQAATQEQQREFNTEQQNLSPWINAGEGALGQLVKGIQPGGGLADPFTEKFDPSKVQFDPGFQYRLDQANKAIQASAAAHGRLNSGGTLMQIDRNTQDLAGQEYQNAYGRALTNYQTDENTFFNNQTNQYNKLAGVAGIGQNGVAQLNQAGQASTAAQAQLGTAGAAATAAGIVGSTNAITGGLSSGASALGNNLILSQLLKGGQAQTAGLPPGYSQAWQGWAENQSPAVPQPSPNPSSY